MLSTEDKRWLTDMFDVRFAEQDKRIDAKFTEQDKRIDAKFNEQDKRIGSLKEEMYELNEDTRRYFDVRLDQVYSKLDQILEVLPGAKQSFANHEERITVLENNDRDKTHLLTNLYKQINAAK